MTTPRGPVLDPSAPRYYKHPPGGSGYAQDGRPLDSGTAHILHNNVSVLAHENTRHIGWIKGPGSIGSATPDWSGIVDASPSEDNAPYSMIPWVQGRDAVVMGPFVPSYTRIGTDPPGMYPRKVQVVVHLTKSATSSSVLDVMACLVSGEATPLRGQVVASETKRLTEALHAGERYVPLTLDCARPLAPSENWRSRPSGSAVAAVTAVHPLHLWVGWLSNDVSASDFIAAVSAFEIP